MSGVTSSSIYPQNSRQMTWIEHWWKIKWDLNDIWPFLRLWWVKFYKILYLFDSTIATISASVQSLLRFNFQLQQVWFWDVVEFCLYSLQERRPLEGSPILFTTPVYLRTAPCSVNNTNIQTQTHTNTNTILHKHRLAKTHTLRIRSGCCLSVYC